MALSKEAKERLIIALTSRATGKEVADAIESADKQAEAVAELGALTAVGSTDGSGGAGDAALAADVDARLESVQEKLDELIAALVDAKIVAE
jgi:hypothetical protein